MAKSLSDLTELTAEFKREQIELVRHIHAFWDSNSALRLYPGDGFGLLKTTVGLILEAVHEKNRDRACLEIAAYCLIDLRERARYNERADFNL